MKYITRRISLVIALGFIVSMALGACGAGKVTIGDDLQLESRVQVEDLNPDKEVGVDSIFILNVDDVAGLSGIIKYSDEFGEGIVSLEFSTDILFSQGSSKAEETDQTGELTTVYVRPANNVLLPQKVDCVLYVYKDQVTLLEAPFRTGCGGNTLITNFASMMECVDFHEVYIDSSLSIVLAQISSQEFLKMYPSATVIEKNGLRYLKTGSFNFGDNKYQLADMGIKIASIIMSRAEESGVDLHMKAHIYQDGQDSLPAAYVGAVGLIASDGEDTITYLNGKVTTSTPTPLNGGVETSSSTVAGYMGSIREFIYSVLGQFMGAQQIQIKAPVGGGGIPGFQTFVIADEDTREFLDYREVWDGLISIDYLSSVKKVSFSNDGNKFMFNNVSAVDATENFIKSPRCGGMIVDMDYTEAAGASLDKQDVCYDESLTYAGKDGCFVYDELNCESYYGYDPNLFDLVAVSCYWHIDPVKGDSCRECSSVLEDNGYCVNSCVAEEPEEKVTPEYLINVQVE